MPSFTVTCPYCLEVDKITHTRSERIARCTHCRRNYKAPEYRTDGVPVMAEKTEVMVRYQAEPKAYDESLCMALPPNTYVSSSTRQTSCVG